MTPTKLNEFKKKFEEKQGDINDVGLVLCELFKSLSTHLKEIKSTTEYLVDHQEQISIQIEDSLNPVYTIIQSED